MCVDDATHLAAVAVFSVSTEFLGLMKKVAKSPLVMDVLNIANVQRQLERLADLLTKIQKALGEYLERERASFPRFYFVGDEDLLEIIGNSKNLPRLQKHFKKMFAGVYSIVLDDDHAQVLGIASKEGEEVSHACQQAGQHLGTSGKRSTSSCDPARANDIYTQFSVV